MTIVNGIYILTMFFSITDHQQYFISQLLDITTSYNNRLCHTSFIILNLRTNNIILLKMLPVYEIQSLLNDFSGSDDTFKSNTLIQHKLW